MKKSLALASLALSFAYADPPKIELPTQPPEDTTAQVEAAGAQAEPMSISVPDPKNRDWKEYDNRIVKAHVRVQTAWLMMEVKETRESGSVSFTLSRLPMVTFAVSREPMAGDFDLYLSSASLTPLYPVGFKKSPASFAGRGAVLVRGKGRDGRLDESYFSTDGHSIYQVSFSAPEADWKDALSPFAGLKESFRWLP